MQNTSLPVICLTKSIFEDGFVRITGSFAEVEALLKINATFIAVDGTYRIREKQYTGPDYIKKIKKMSFFCRLFFEFLVLCYKVKFKYG